MIISIIKWILQLILKRGWGVPTPYYEDYLYILQIYFFGSVWNNMLKNMEDLCLRFPGVCDMVLSHLDNHSLMRCKISSREMCHYLDNERFIFKRIIKKYVSGQIGFSQCWKKVINRASTDILKQLATAVIKFSGWRYYRRNEKVQWSPLHIAAEQGRLPLKWGL